MESHCQTPADLLVPVSSSIGTDISHFKTAVIHPKLCLPEADKLPDDPAAVGATFKEVLSIIGRNKSMIGLALHGQASLVHNFVWNRWADCEAMVLLGTQTASRKGWVRLTTGERPCKSELKLDPVLATSCAICYGHYLLAPDYLVPGLRLDKQVMTKGYVRAGKSINPHERPHESLMTSKAILAEVLGGTDPLGELGKTVYCHQGAWWQCSAAQLKPFGISPEDAASVVEFLVTVLGHLMRPEDASQQLAREADWGPRWRTLNRAPGGAALSSTTADGPLDGPYQVLIRTARREFQEEVEGSSGMRCSLVPREVGVKGRSHNQLVLSPSRAAQYAALEPDRTVKPGAYRFRIKDSEDNFVKANGADEGGTLTTFHARPDELTFELKIHRADGLVFKVHLDESYFTDGAWQRLITFCRNRTLVIP